MHRAPPHPSDKTKTREFTVSRRATTTARVAAVAASAAAGALLLTACSPVTTNLDYDPSDGVRVELSRDLHGSNLMVVSEGDGAPGNVLGALTNRSSDPATFTLEAEGAAALEIEVGPRTTVFLGTADGEEAQLDAVDTAPGTHLAATLSAGDTAQEFDLPVFDGTLPEYQDYLP